MKKLVLLYVFFWIDVANAGLIEINARDAGWYDQTGLHLSDNTNHIAGTFQYHIGQEFHSYIFRNFFVFDLGTINEKVTSATFQIYSNKVTGTGTYTLFDVSTPTELLLMDGYKPDTYIDLGEGVAFGAVDINPDQSQQTLEIILNESALAAINLTNGMFSMGGAFPTNAINSYIFAESYSIDHIKLLLNTASTPVPQPNAFALFIIGLCGLAYFRRIKMNKLSLNTKP